MAFALLAVSFHSWWSLSPFSLTASFCSKKNPNPQSKWSFWIPIFWLVKSGMFMGGCVQKHIRGIYFVLPCLYIFLCGLYLSLPLSPNCSHFSLLLLNSLFTSEINGLYSLQCLSLFSPFTILSGLKLPNVNWNRPQTPHPVASVTLDYSELLILSLMTFHMSEYRDHS